MPQEVRAGMYCRRSGDRVWRKIVRVLGNKRVGNTFGYTLVVWYRRVQLQKFLTVEVIMTGGKLYEFSPTVPSGDDYEDASGITRSGVHLTPDQYRAALMRE